MKKKVIYSLVGVMCISTIAVATQKTNKQAPVAQKAIISVASRDPGITDPLTSKSRIKRSVDPGIPDPLT